MAEVTAAAVKSLREKTGLPMMDCKRALQDADGDQQKAVELLRKAGMKTMQKRVGRETSFGRIAVYTDFQAGVGAMIELRCESAPVAANQEFVRLADDLARQLATGPGANTPEELLEQSSPGKPGQTLKEQFDDLNHRIREVFKLQRIARMNTTCGGYAHHNAAAGVLLAVEGGTADLAKDVSMHVAAMRPKVVTKEDLDPAEVDKERAILAEAARKEGKPENIIAKMVEGRLREFYAQHCLAEQPFVKDDKRTVGKVAQDAGMKIVRFIHWELAKE
jgi:elongation factor Ts